MNRKAKDRLRRNAGGTAQQDDERFNEAFYPDAPQRAQVRTAIVMPERLIRSVLLSEVERLRGDEEELRRFFSHFYDPTTSDDERETYVRDFVNNPPRVVLGYPRTTGSWPMFSIVHSSDEEAEPGLLSKFIGETQLEEAVNEESDYEGGFFTQSYAVYVFATHPDQCLYLYHFAKLMLIGAREALEAAGVIDPHYSGGELNPEEMQLPDNAWARVLNVTLTTLVSIPKLRGYRNGRNMRLAGIFRSDVVVDGLRGGVETYVAGEDDDEAQG